MGWKKRELIEAAFGELALAGHVFDLQPEEMQAALRRMDAMIAFWDGKGIKLGYALNQQATASDLDADSGLPAWANEPVFLNLAVRIAGSAGKTLAPQTVTAAKEGYDNLLLRATLPRPTLTPGGMPLGAGNRRRGRTFTPDPDTSPLRQGEGGDLDFIGS